MNIYNLFFDKTEKETKVEAGWHISQTYKGVKLTANVGGTIKTIVNATDRLRALTINDATGVDLNTLVINPGYKNAHLELPTEVPNLNFAIYVRASEGEQISSIKLEGCSVVMSNITSDRKEAAMLIIVQDPEAYRIRVYQTDKKLILMQNGKFKISTIDHDLNMSKKLRPRLYLQLPEKAFFTTDVKSEVASQMIAMGYRVVYTPMFLVGNKYLDTSSIITPDGETLLSGGNSYIIDIKDKEKYGMGVEDTLKEIHKDLNIKYACYDVVKKTDIILFLPLKAFLTSDMKSDLSTQMKDMGYSVIYIPMLLDYGTYLDADGLINNDIVINNNEYIIDMDDIRIYGKCVESSLKSIHKDLNIKYAFEDVVKNKAIIYEIVADDDVYNC